MFVKNAQEFILNSCLVTVAAMLMYCAMVARDHFAVKRVFARSPR